jgi:hypothetical protein
VLYVFVWKKNSRGYFIGTFGMPGFSKRRSGRHFGGLERRLFSAETVGA